SDAGAPGFDKNYLNGYGVAVRL
nr:NSP11 [Duck coronavirus]